MRETRPGQRGVVSGMLNLARNLGFMTGASVLGAVFALASLTAGASARSNAALYRRCRRFILSAPVRLAFQVRLGC